MSTANILGFSKSKANSPRNAFDMSHDVLFNSPAGMLLPCYNQMVKKGDKLKLSVKNFTRTNAVNTAAFMSFSEKVDFYFVPMTLLFSAYDNWRLSATYNHRSTDLLNVGNLNRIPYASWSQLSTWFAHLDRFDDGEANPTTLTPVGLFGSSYFATTLRYLDLLEYGLPPLNNLTSQIHGRNSFTPSYSDHPTWEFVTSSSVKTYTDAIRAYYNTLHSAGLFFNYFKLAAFQCIYMHNYRNEDYEPMDPSYFNVDSLFLSVNTVSGTNYAAIDTAFSSSPAATLDFSDPSRLSSGFDSLDEYARPKFPTYSPNSTVLDDYQNAIRISWSKLFTPRFKNWRKDIFTSLKPTNGYVHFIGVDSTGFNYGFGNFTPKNNIPSSGSASTTIPVQGGSTSDDSLGGYNYIKINPTTGLPVLAMAFGNNEANLRSVDLRLLSSLDKFARLSIYADKNISSQYEALFGVKYKDPHRPEYLGTYDSSITISEVVATSAGTDGTTDAATSILGEIAGKGIGSGDTGSKDIINNTFDCDGIVIGVHYIMPFNYYNPYRIDRFNVKTSRFDYYYPSFDGLGLSPVYQFDRGLGRIPFSNPITGPTHWYGKDPFTYRPTSLVGFNSRYFEYKQRLNQVHGTFSVGQPDSFWTMTMNNTPETSNTESLYKIDPSCTNSIFAVNWDGTPATDPFKCFFSFKSVLVSDMEQHGTPNV